MSNIRVLHITNAYPNSTMPEYGIFIKEQVDALTDINSEVLFINAVEKGSTEYLRSIFKLRKLQCDFDVIHCHHFYSFLVCYFAFGYRPNVIVSFLNDWDREIELSLPVRWKKKLLNFFSKKMPVIIFKSFPPIELINRSNIYFLPNGVDSKRFNVIDRTECIKKLELNEEKHYLLFVSSKWLGRRR